MHRSRLSLALATLACAWCVPSSGYAQADDTEPRTPDQLVDFILRPTQEAGEAEEEQDIWNWDTEPEPSAIDEPDRAAARRADRRRSYRAAARRTDPRADRARAAANPADDDRRALRPARHQVSEASSSARRSRSACTATDNAGGTIRQGGGSRRNPGARDTSHFRGRAVISLRRTPAARPSPTIVEEFNEAHGRRAGKAPLRPHQRHLARGRGRLCAFPRRLQRSRYARRCIRAPGRRRVRRDARCRAALRPPERPADRLRRPRDARGRAARRGGGVADRSELDNTEFGSRAPRRLCDERHAPAVRRGGGRAAAHSTRRATTAASHAPASGASFAVVLSSNAARSFPAKPRSATAARISRTSGWRT